MGDPNRIAVQQLLKLPENQRCADCHRTQPTWASITLGVFICLDCSAHHRAMGTHISKVKSTTLDTWTPQMVEFMKKMGNARANEIYERGLPPNYPRPTNHEQREAFIRQKYEQKKFINPLPQIPIAQSQGFGGGVAPASLTMTSSSSSSETPANLQRPSPTTSNQSSITAPAPRRHRAPPTAGAVTSSVSNGHRAPPTAAATGPVGGESLLDFTTDALSSGLTISSTPTSSAFPINSSPPVPPPNLLDDFPTSSSRAAQSTSSSSSFSFISSAAPSPPVSVVNNLELVARAVREAEARVQALLKAMNDVMARGTNAAEACLKDLERVAHLTPTGLSAVFAATLRARGEELERSTLPKLVEELRSLRAEFDATNDSLRNINNVTATQSLARTCTEAGARISEMLEAMKVGN